MKSIERILLEQLRAAAPDAVWFWDLRNVHGWNPRGRKGLIEKTLIRLRETGLVQGDDARYWRITEQGEAALAEDG